MLFIKTMRAISQLYKGPIVQDNEIMISSHLRLHRGKELHSHQGHIQGPEDRTLAKEEPCRCPALVSVKALLPELSRHTHQSHQVWLPLAPEEIARCQAKLWRVWLLPPGFQRLPQCLVERELWCGWRRMHRAPTTVMPSRLWEWGCPETPDR